MFICLFFDTLKHALVALIPFSTQRGYPALSIQFFARYEILILRQDVE